jgi:hypothetical protein
LLYLAIVLEISLADTMILALETYTLAAVRRTSNQAVTRFGVGFCQLTANMMAPEQYAFTYIRKELI